MEFPIFCCIYGQGHSSVKEAHGDDLAYLVQNFVGQLILSSGTLSWTESRLYISIWEV